MSSPTTHSQNLSPSETALAYAEDVLAERVPACRYVRSACQRFLGDLSREGWRYRYDVARADAAVRWIGKLRHTKGRWAARGEPLQLAPWQQFIVCNIFGWVDDQGRRRFRTAYIEVPRKNGKSLLAAAIGLRMFCADEEFGAEVYSGATSEHQAWEIFRPAKQLCERLPALTQHYDIEVNAKSLSILSNGSRFAPIIGKPGDGASPSCALVDEFHEHQTSDLVDTMKTGMGAREQPLLLIVTTAGSNFGGPCYEMRSDMVRVLDNQVEDDTLFAVIYTLDPDDAWDDEGALAKANPNYDVSVSGEFLRQELSAARRSASKQNAFKTKHLNLWVGAKVAWMNMLAFQRCRDTSLRLADFAGEDCVVALDLASKVDIASMVAVFSREDQHYVFAKHYLPEDTVNESPTIHYRPWAEAGVLTVTPGATIDFDFIEEDLRALATRHRVREVPYDPYQATQFASHMAHEGLPMIEVRPTVLNFSEPMKQVEALVLARKLWFADDPVMTWMMGNVVARRDAKDNIYPNKERPENKIDGVVALIMAMARVLAKPQGSVYESRGVITV